MIKGDNSESFKSIGFRHILEDALSIVRKRDGISAERKQYVLADLANLFDQARHGSEVVERLNFYFDPAESTAVQSFVLIEHHLPESEGSTLTGNLATVSKTLNAIITEQDVEAEDRDTAEKILVKMLTNVRLSGGVGLPQEPESLVWEE